MSYNYTSDVTISAEEIRLVLEAAIQNASLSFSGDLFQELADIIKTRRWADTKARKSAVQAILTYHQLVKLGGNSNAFKEVIYASKMHVSDSLALWSKSEYEHVLTDYYFHFPVMLQHSPTLQALHRTKLAQYEFDEWIQEQLANKETRSDPNGVLAEFYTSQTEKYSEEEETLKMMSLFSKVYRAYGVQKHFDGKVLCDIAHPTTMKELNYGDDFPFRCLEQLSIDSRQLVDYISRIEPHKDIDTHEANELMRVLAMQLWKSLHCFKLVAFNSKVLTKIMFMPSYSGEAMWNHNTSSEWTLGVRIRDSPVVESITIGVIVIIGLLCTSATLQQILLSTDVFLIKRAVTLLDAYTELHRPKTK